MQTFWLNRRRLQNTKPALERSNSFQFSLAHIIKLGAWLIHHYNISDLKQHNYDCRTVLLIEKLKRYNCGSDFSFLKISLFYITCRLQKCFMLQFARLYFICWRELTVKLNELSWSWQCAHSCINAWRIHYLSILILILKIIFAWQIMSLKCIFIISGNLHDSTYLLFWS